MPGGWEWMIVIAVLLLLFGAKRLPDMARSVGQSARVFKGEMKGLRDDDERNSAQGGSPTTAPLTAPAGPPPPARIQSAGSAVGDSLGNGASGPPRNQPALRDTAH